MNPEETQAILQRVLKGGGSQPSPSQTTQAPAASSVAPSKPQAVPSDTNAILQRVLSPSTPPEQKEALKKAAFSAVEDKHSAASKFLEGAKMVGKTLVKGVNPALGTALETGTGEDVAGGVLKIGAENLKSSAKPFAQPFAMATGKDIESLDVKAEPTPGEALGEAVSAGLWIAPVEKVLAPVFKPIGKFLSGFGERMAGALSGKGTEAISEVLKNPELALQGLKGKDIEILKTNAKIVRDEVLAFAKTHKEDYAKALEDLPKRLGANPQVVTDNAKTTIKVGGKIYVLSKQQAKTAITDILRGAGVKVDRAKDFLDFTESPLNEAEGKAVQKVWNLINNWTDTTPKGLNNLAVKIGDFKRTGPGNEYFNSTIGKVKESIRDYLGSRIPTAGEMNLKYAESASTLEKLRDIFDVPNNFETKEGLIDVAKKMQTLFSGKKQLERDFIKASLPSGEEVVAREAGRLIAQSPSQASASIGDAVKNLIQTVISPKAVGEIVARTGIASEKIKPVLETLQKLAPAERQAFLNLFTSDQAPLE